MVRLTSLVHVPSNVIKFNYFGLSKIAKSAHKQQSLLISNPYNEKGAHN